MRQRNRRTPVVEVSQPSDLIRGKMRDLRGDNRRREPTCGARANHAVERRIARRRDREHVRATRREGEAELTRGVGSGY